MCFIYLISPGCQLGTALQLMVSGFIADYWGWPAIFYLNGTLGALWTVAYVFLGSPSPQNSKVISEEERIYIQTSLGQVGEQKVPTSVLKADCNINSIKLVKFWLFDHASFNCFKKLQTPWKAIWTSLPFISLIIAHCGQNWGFWTLMTEMPSYMKQVLGVDIKAVC